MAQFGVVTSTATSLYTVSSDIAHVLRKLGYETVLYEFPTTERDFEKCILTMAYDPLYVRPYIVFSKDLSREGKRNVMYVTTEGVPKKVMITSWMRTGVTYIAVSNYVKAMLESVGVMASKVIYHGINYDILNLVASRIQSRKIALKNRLGAKVVFGTVASNHPRKNLKGYASVLKQVVEQVPNAGFFIVTTEQGVSNFAGIPRVQAVPLFGKLTRDEILSTIGSFDFYVHPTYSEGFGLPLLEAQALGIPVIYPYYSPLTEITLEEANLPVEIMDVSSDDFGEGIDFTIHYFDTNSMISQIKNAYDIYLNNKSKYEDMSTKVKEFAKRFDAENLYKEFVDILR